MAGVFYSPDRVWRVELVRQHNRPAYRVWYHGAWFRDCRSVADLQRLLREEARLDVADLVED